MSHEREWFSERDSLIAIVSATSGAAWHDWRVHGTPWWLAATEWAGALVTVYFVWRLFTAAHRKLDAALRSHYAPTSTPSSHE